MSIQRIVCLKFKDDTSTEEIDAHLAALAKLKTQIPQIQTYRAGRGLSGDFGSAPQYDTLHYLTFATLDDVDLYFHHEEHQRFIEQFKHLWEDVLVLNAEIVH